MSPHLGSEVGVRELNNQLSRYVRAAADGQEVVITMHGRPVARMVPMDADPLGDLRTAGLVQDPTGDSTPTWAQREPASSPLDDLLDEQRR